MPTRWRHVTPHTAAAPAAIGVIHLDGDIDGALVRAGMAPVGVGGVALRRFGDIDRGVVARPSDDALLLMPHAGPAVLRRMSVWLESLGFGGAEMDDPRTLYPEASSLLEARMLHALARAASPLAIDMLLDQPRRWAGVSENDPELLARSVVLNRLIDPPTVVALGPPNIGKSTLLNTLAGRSVSIVADEPGTTRDHVGVRLDLAGLVVSYLDTPGIDPAGARDEIQREAQELAVVAAGEADVVMLCGDSKAPFLEMPSGARSIVRVGLRADLGGAEGADVQVSVRTGAGIEGLVAALRERLVPGAVLGHPGAWRFW